MVIAGKYKHTAATARNRRMQVSSEETALHSNGNSKNAVRPGDSFLFARRAQEINAAVSNTIVPEKSRRLQNLLPVAGEGESDI